MTSTHIVGHDGRTSGDDALALSRALAPAEDVRRIVAHVIAYGQPDFTPSEQFVASCREDAERRLAGVRAALREGEELRIVLAVSVARGLHELAEREDAALVVVGPTHRHDVARALLGTTADRLLHGSSCAVAAAAPGFREGGAVGRLVVGYDGWEEGRLALEAAAEVATATGGTVDVVTAVHPVAAFYGHPGAAGMAGVAREAADRAAAAASAEALSTLPSAVAGRATMPEGPAGRAIVAAASERSADLVVVGSRAYGPVKRVLLGSTGRDVLHHAPCSVLVVPRGAATHTGTTTDVTAPTTCVA